MHARLRLLAALVLLAVLGSPALLQPAASAAAGEHSFFLWADDDLGGLPALRPAEPRLGPQGEGRPAAPAEAEGGTALALRPAGPNGRLHALPSFHPAAAKRPACEAGASGNRGPPPQA